MPMNNKVNGNFSYVALGRIIPMASQATFFLIFASLLEPNEYGIMGYLIALAGTFSAVSRFGFPQTVVVYQAKKETQKADQVNLFALIATSIASIILLFIDQVTAILCLGTSFFFMYQHNLLGEKKYKHYMKNAVLRAILTFSLPFPLYFAFGIPGIVLGIAVGYLISSLGYLKFINFKVRSFNLLKQNYKVLINNFAVSANTTLVRQLDRILVAAVFGFVFVGVYVFIMQVLIAVEILPRALYLYLLSEESSGKKHQKITSLVVVASGLMAVAVIIFSPFVIEEFFPNYSDGIPALQILVISIIPGSIALILSAKMQAMESTKVGFSAVIRIGSLLILIGVLGSLYELIGFSIAVLISTSLNALFLYSLYLKIKPDV